MRRSERKSYRRASTVAPYQRPISSPMQKRSTSLFGKIKDLFHINKPSTSRLDAASNSAPSNRQTSRTASLGFPGGFYTGEKHFQTPNGSISQREDDTASLKDSAYKNINQIEDAAYDESFEASTINSKLANFFKSKGDEPLSEEERAGVLSMLSRAGSSNASRRSSIMGNNLENLSSSQILRNPEAPAQISFRPPSFIPKYDESPATQSRESSSIRRLSSRKRIFDYSAVSSPYRATVYKYSVSADGDKYSKSALNEDQKQTARGDNEEKSPKRLSNTAAALVSLLEGNISGADAPVSDVANPYSSRVKKYKSSKGESGTVSARSNDNVASENSKNKDEEALTHQTPEKGEPEKLKITKKRSLNENKAFNKYQPTRSSSLRSSVINADVSPDKVQQDNSEVKLDTPQTSTVNFTFSKTEKSPEALSQNVDEPATAKESFKPTKQSSFKPSVPSSAPFANFTETTGEKTKEAKTSRKELPCNVGSDLGTPTYKDKNTNNAQLQSNKSLFSFDSVILPSSNVNASAVDEKEVSSYRQIFIF